MIQIDARGYSCPEPVLRLKRVIDTSDEIELLVDNQTSAKVCGRYARSKGFSVDVRSIGRNYVLEIRK